MKGTTGITLTLALLGSIPLRAAEAPEGIEFFEKKIRPVLTAKCYRCHSADAKKLKGNLLLDTREGTRKGGDTGPAVVPGNETKSLLMKALRYEKGLEMPPNERLEQAVIDDFAKWIALGAPDPRDGKRVVAANAIDIDKGRQHWSFQPLANPPVPRTREANWVRSDIDRFILAGLETKGLVPVTDAAPLDMLRRISFDLTGLPPTPARITEFETRYRKSAASAVAGVIDEMLASPHFGERWGRHWLDLARYAESNGGASNVLVPLAPRYRDYVIDAFHADKPYDQFVREQLAGDLLPAANDAQRNEQLIATGFLALGSKDLRERNLHRLRMSVVEEQIDVVGRTFLGLTIACARCHDHKFDPIPTQDYYALAGIFYSSQPRMGVNTKGSSYVAGLEPLAGRGMKFTEEDLKRFVKETDEARKKNLFLRDEKRRVLLEANLLKAKEKVQEEFLKKSAAVQKALADKEKQDAKLAEIQERFDACVRQSAIAMRDVKPQDVAVHIRGEDTQLGEIAPRGFPQVLVNDSSPQVNRQQSGRLELAQWIASPNHPLTARVMVNRIWQHLFGVGLVESPDNFGKTGQAPSNPALLDHLAQRFIAQRWSVKSLIREIMLSHVYQLGTDHNPAAYRVDPSNRLHWRMSCRRLDSDALFDSMALIAGELKLERPPERFAIVDGRQDVKMFDRTAWLKPVAQQRTVYQPIFREYVPHDWSLFDFPDPELVVGRREVTTVPTQALFMMNSPVVVAHAQRLAKRISADHQGNHAVRQAYLHVLGRYPSEEEQSGACHFLEHFAQEATQPDSVKALTALCQTLFAAAEFRYLY